MTTHPTLWFEHFVEKPQTSEMMKQFDIFLVKTTVITWVVVSNIFYFHPYLGKWSKLTYNFQMGWNHQLDNFKPPLCDVKITILHDVFSIVTCQPIFAIVFMYIYLHLPYKSNQKVSRSTHSPGYSRLGPSPRPRKTTRAVTVEQYKINFTTWRRTLKRKSYVGDANCTGWWG